MIYKRHEDSTNGMCCFRVVFFGFAQKQSGNQLSALPPVVAVDVPRGGA
jgi:hypothetical protein